MIHKYLVLTSNNTKQYIFVWKIFNNTKENFLWEPKKTNVQFHKMTPYTVKFSEFYLCFHNSCEMWRLFSTSSRKKLPLALSQITNYIYNPWKM